jgi:hypothetical protein
MSAPARPPVPVRVLAPGAELPPKLSAPQPGSAALTGNDTQGIYEGFLSHTFISNTGRLMFRDTSRWIFGSIAVNGLDWTFKAPTLTFDGSDSWNR